MKSSDIACLSAFALAVLGTSDGLGYLFGRSYMEPCERGAGACMTAVECGVQRGHPLGACAIGVCCRIEKTCMETITYNNTYFVNPVDTRPGSSCDVTVEKKWVPGGICQLRLDFFEFQTVEPNFVNGMCVHDFFSVTGADTAPPLICGQNDRQHIYVDVRKARSVHLMMNLGLNVTTRRWKIKVSQIPCYSSRLAPPDCLQYFEEPSGYIKSFNYGNIFNDSSYPLNTRYRMCFREACTTQLLPVGPFGLGQRADNGTADDIGGIAVDQDCIDYKRLGQTSSAYLAVDNIRFCGSRFLRSFQTPNPVSSLTFVAPIRENRRDQSNTAPYNGFNIQYRQNCGSRGNFDAGLGWARYSNANN